MLKQLVLQIEIDNEEEEVVEDYFQIIIELVDKVLELTAFGFDTPAFQSKVIDVKPKQ